MDDGRGGRAMNIESGSWIDIPKSVEHALVASVCAMHVGSRSGAWRCPSLLRACACVLHIGIIAYAVLLVVASWLHRMKAAYPPAPPPSLFFLPLSLKKTLCGFLTWRVPTNGWHRSPTLTAADGGSMPGPAKHPSLRHPTTI
eukprot:scaffold15240_cov128-Isochrysis_galbana.AAC.1